MTTPLKPTLIIYVLVATLVTTLGISTYRNYSQRQEISALEAQITAQKQVIAQRDLALQTQTQISRAKEAALEKVQADLIAEKNRLPEVPVKLGIRPAMMGAGLVAQFSNYSSQHLSLIIAVFNPTTGKSKQFVKTLSPSSPAEIGHAEGWAFASGDRVSLMSSGFTTVEKTIP